MKTTTKLITLALSVQMLAAPAMAAFFQDTQSNWAKGPIQSLSDQGILTGYPDGSFRPEGLITRAEFSAMMVKALSLNINATGQQTFVDVPTSNWAYPSIETVRATGLVSGYPGGQFMPAKSISRAEAMAILSNAARIPMPNDNTVNQVLASYRDNGSIPTWARPGVAAAIQSGIYANDPNAGNAIEPQQPATRAEVAAMVENLRARMNLAGGQQGGMNTTTGAGGMTTQNGQTVLQGRVATVPANTKFTGTISQGMLSSELNKVGDTIRLKVDQPLMSADNQVIIPVGSEIVGKVSMVQAAGRTGKPGAMDIDFTEIQTPDGQRYTIQGSVATEDGVLRGDTTKGRILKTAGTTALGAGLGAALGTAMGPLSGGKVGKGAIYGTAVGAGAGAIAAGIKKGKEVAVGSGDKLEIKLDQPINVQVNQQQ